MIKKSDILAALIIAEADAWLIIVISKNIGWDFSLIKLGPLILPVLAVFGLFVAQFLGKKFLPLFQFFKFGLTGSFNTFIDLGILNLLMWFSGITVGLSYSVFVGIAFIVAHINSYLWNKFWTFKKRETPIASREIFQFFSIAVVGLLIHIIVASLIVNVWGPQFGISPKIWANVGKLIAVFAGMFWNFCGYKFLVFKK